MASETYKDKTVTRLERMRAKATMGIWATSADTQTGDTFVIENSNYIAFYTMRVWLRNYRQNHDKTRRFKANIRVVNDDNRQDIIITRVE